MRPSVALKITRIHEWRGAKHGVLSDIRPSLRALCTVRSRITFASALAAFGLLQRRETVRPLLPAAILEGPTPQHAAQGRRSPRGQAQARREARAGPPRPADRRGEGESEGEVSRACGLGRRRRRRGWPRLLLQQEQADCTQTITVRATEPQRRRDRASQRALERLPLGGGEAWHAACVHEKLVLLALRVVVQPHSRPFFLPGWRCSSCMFRPFHPINLCLPVSC